MNSRCWLHAAQAGVTAGGIGVVGSLTAPGCRLPPMTTPTPPPAGSEPPALPPDSADLFLQAGLGPFGLDRLGATEAVGGLAIGLIALFSSYDHIAFAGRNVAIPQQWGITFIAASVAIIVIDAQLASRSRLRAAKDAQRAADQADRRENEADRERNRAAEARERQRQATARLDRCALLSARVLLDPSESNRARLQAFLALISQPMPEP